MPAAKKAAAGHGHSAKNLPGQASPIAELIQLQQQCVGRVADFWAKGATRLVEGNFDVTRWLADYSEIWKGMVDDVGVVLKATLLKKR